MISILFLTADPTNASRLRLGEEAREIQEKLQLAKLRDRFVLHQRTSVRPSDISQSLLDVNPQIVHFSGHGTSAGALCFENNLGELHPIQPEALAALFEQFASRVSCVILNACYSVAQAQAIAKHIQYVIGMNQAIGDKAAIAFSIGFYQALGAGRSVEEAYKLGCVQIGLQNIPEHLTPVLVKENPSEKVQVDFFTPDNKPPSFYSRSTPPPPTLIVGREEALSELKARLGIRKQSSPSVQILTTIRGWPGVGKTTVASAIAHDPEVTSAFPDGILWVSLGQKPDLLSELGRWGQELGASDFLNILTITQASERLAGLLRDKRILLIVDDVWSSADAIPFLVGGRGCAILFTTRETSIAQALAPTPQAIYVLPVLTDQKSLELLQTLAPTAVAEYPTQCLELVHALEGLPLALQVAGRLLNAESNYGFSVVDLLTELRDGVRLLQSQAPLNRIDIVSQTTPTIAVLLKKSTDRLDEKTRERFAYLGAFVSKPAHFDLSAMKAVWKVEDPKPIVRQLVDRGLLEFVAEINRYQIHALLVAHARSLCVPE